MPCVNILVLLYCVLILFDLCYWVVHIFSGGLVVMLVCFRCFLFPLVGSAGSAEGWTGGVVDSYILKYLTELCTHCVYNFVFYPLKVSARGENVIFFFRVVLLLCWLLYFLSCSLFSAANSTFRPFILCLICSDVGNNSVTFIPL